MELANITAGAALLYCPPVTQIYTTVYETTLLAACETGSWMAAYTVTETCAGHITDYVTPTMPPGFVVTTVHCHACEDPDVVITCPGAKPTGMGNPMVNIECDNGVTATITAPPVPPHTHVAPPSIPTGGFTTSYAGGCGGSGCDSGVGGGSSSESGSYHDHDHDHDHDHAVDYSCDGSDCDHDHDHAVDYSCDGSDCGHDHDHDHDQDSSCGASGCDHGHDHDQGYSCDGEDCDHDHDHDHDYDYSCGGAGCDSGSSYNGSSGLPPVLTGAAASVHRSLVVGAGLAFLAVPFFLL
ncbi:hypothetical protein F4808DRAFT_138436 [Astrocystis sublimbata]|nr:hypothetical protein F4808DRAFT_138436 [Astrocystis sublimbata]